ncbi:MAG: hypothetical protein HXS40_10590 [Theionarchaea archaeon]|nr:hypothetical protein [Theionarchaea archaeon]
MNYEEFISSRENRWGELDQLSSHIQHQGYSSLSRDDLDSFLVLYRQACADLAYVRTYCEPIFQTAGLKNISTAWWPGLIPSCPEPVRLLHKE